MPPKNNVNYGGECYFMMTRDDGTIYEVTGSVEEVSVGELFVSAWADDNNYRRLNVTDTLTIRLRRDLSFNGPFHGLFTPKRIIRNGPAMVVFWWDGTKTVVKCHNEDFDVEKGLAMALCRKMWGRSRTEHFLKKVEEQG